MDQSKRYANLNLKERDLIAGGLHVLCAYIMRPKAGYEPVATAAHFAAESSTGTNVEVSTTDDFTRGVDALVYECSAATGGDYLVKIAYPIELFDRNIRDGRAMLASFLTLTVGNNQGMGDVEYAKMHDFYVPPKLLALFDGIRANALVLAACGWPEPAFLALAATIAAPSARACRCRRACSSRARGLDGGSR